MIFQVAGDYCVTAVVAFSWWGRHEANHSLLHRQLLRKKGWSHVKRYGLTFLFQAAASWRLIDFSRWVEGRVIISRMGHGRHRWNVGVKEGASVTKLPNLIDDPIQPWFWSEKVKLENAHGWIGVRSPWRWTTWTRRNLRSGGGFGTSLGDEGRTTGG